MRFKLFVAANLLLLGLLGLSLVRAWDLTGLQQSARAALQQGAETGNAHRGAGARAVSRVGGGRSHK